mgnify:CR=1 FL=1
MAGYLSWFWLAHLISTSLAWSYLWKVLPYLANCSCFGVCVLAMVVSEDSLASVRAKTSALLLRFPSVRCHCRCWILSLFRRTLGTYHGLTVAELDSNWKLAYLSVSSKCLSNLQSILLCFAFRYLLTEGRSWVPAAQSCCILSKSESTFGPNTTFKIGSSKHLRWN